MRELTRDDILAASPGAAAPGPAGRRRVDAELLRDCCRRLRDAIDPRGIRLDNVLVTGRLDLSGIDVPFPLLVTGSTFEEPLVAEGARLHQLALTDGTELPGLLANGVTVRRDLDLSGSRVTGAHRTSASTSKRSAIWLCEAEIGGRLLCQDTVIDGSGERSIQADRLHVAGNIRLLHRFAARGEIRMIGARVGGSLDLTGASLESPATGLALDLGEAAIDGSLFLVEDQSGRRPSIRGRVDMGGARVGGQFLVRNATMTGLQAVPVGSGYSRHRTRGTVLSAPRLSVGAELTLDGSCLVTGGLDLAMSELSSVSIGPRVELQAAGQTALNLRNAELLSGLTLARGLTVHGTIMISGARIRGRLGMRGVEIDSPGGRSLIAAVGTRVDGEADLREMTATGGELAFQAASIGGQLDTSGAHLDNDGNYTLNLTQAQIGGSVRLTSGFTSHGVVVLNRLTADGRLRCSDSTFSCTRPAASGDVPEHAIEAISATFRGGMDLGWASVSPGANFTNATTTYLADDPARWPASYVITGFTYDRFQQPQGFPDGPVWDHAARCAWLAGQATYDAGPYEQAARVFRQHGYADGAREILIAQRRQSRQAITGRWAPGRRAVNVVHGLTVAYGYRPARVLWLLAALLVLVTGSLQLPAARATMRATAQDGTVYSTSGPVAGQPGARRGEAPGRGADECGDGEVRCFNSLLYAVDTVVPLISLDQRTTWYPDARAPDGTAMEWWLNAAAVLGWLLSSIFVLSLAGVARSL